MHSDLDFRVRKNGPTTGLARDANDFYDTEIDSRLTALSCGALDIVCQHCNALRWIGEKNIFFCHDGKVRIDPPPPPQLMKYYDGVYTRNVVYKASVSKVSHTVILL